VKEIEEKDTLVQKQRSIYNRKAVKEKYRIMNTRYQSESERERTNTEQKKMKQAVTVREERNTEGQK
jgi:hypothetical protein